MKVFFTGCTHLGHENIIKLANRPFSNVEEMNETLIERWNERVKPGNIVFHLGDVCWGDPLPFFKRLNGQKFVIIGNHDEESRLRRCRGFGLTETKIYHEIKTGGSRLVLFHYPIDDWNGRWRGSIHLHCHTHSPQFRNPSLPPTEMASGFPPDILCNRFNVGVDACDFAPVSLDQILDEAGKP